MSEGRYQVVLLGKTKPGVSASAVTTRLAQLFKISEGQAGGLLGGQSKVVKRDLDRESAQRYRDILLAVGATARLEPMPMEAPAAQVDPNTITKQPAVDPNAITAQPASPAVDPNAITAQPAAPAPAVAQEVARAAQASEPPPSPAMASAAGGGEEPEWRRLRRQEMVRFAERREEGKLRFLKLFTTLFLFSLLSIYSYREHQYWNQEVSRVRGAIASGDYYTETNDSGSNWRLMESPEELERAMERWDRAHPKVAEKFRELEENPNDQKRILMDLSPAEVPLLLERVAMEKRLRELREMEGYQPDSAEK